MSPILTSPDIAHLIRDGFTVRVTDKYLVVSDIPYLSNDGTVKHNGMIAAALERDGNGHAVQPHDHTVNFFGDELPCVKAGELLELRNSDGTFELDGKKALAYCSRHKEGGKYNDFYEKMKAYVSYIVAPALKVDNTVTARHYKPPQDDTGDSVFAYGDTASCRNQTDDLVAKFESQKVAIVGLGGTGGYVLDVVSKTPVSEIRLFDGDTFYAHNAFRAPGAAPESSFGMKKVEYFAKVYSSMHKGIVPNAICLDENNVKCLDGIDFAFLCLDSPLAKGPIIRYLQEHKIPFVDVGMSIERRDNALGGLIRTTFCTSGEEGKQIAAKYISTVGGDEVNLYDANIQVAELNALNAMFAVMSWKRHLGYYVPSDRSRGASYAHLVYSLFSDMCEHENREQAEAE